MPASFVWVGVLLGGVAGLLVNYLSDVLPATRRISQHIVINAPISRIGGIICFGSGVRPAVQEGPGWILLFWLFTWWPDCYYGCIHPGS
jgi:hypothetical protein